MTTRPDVLLRIYTTQLRVASATLNTLYLSEPSDESNMTTLTQNSRRQPNHCPHKLPTSCCLTARPTCEFLLLLPGLDGHLDNSLTRLCVSR